MANKHCRKFEEHDEYIDAMNNNELSIHTVSYCKEEKDFHYDNDMYLVECIYNVTDTTSPTTLLYSSSYVNKMEIDGVKLNNVVTSYKFNTTGHHIVRYSINTLPVLRYLFMYKHELINFKVNKLISNINFEAFYSSGIYSINIPEFITSIYPSANLYDLTTITVDPENPVYDSRDNCNAIIETATNKLILGCKNTVIPDTVNIIGNNAIYFSNTPDDFYVSTINIPNSVTNILAYGLCIPMLSINLPESVIALSAIDASASTNELRHNYSTSFVVSKLTSITVDEDNPIFDSRNNCNAIIHTSSNTLLYGCKNTIIPNTVTTINCCAFKNIADLTSITIPASVTYIGIRNGQAPFGQCTGLETAIFLSETPPTVTGGNNGHLFSHYTHPNLANIYVPDESVELYKTTFSNAKVIDPDYIELIVPMSTMP